MDYIHNNWKSIDKQYFDKLNLAKLNLDTDFIRGAYHYFNNRFDSAKYYFSKHNTVCYIARLACVYRRQQQYTKAIDTFKRAIDLGDVYSIFNIASLYHDMGQYSIAKKYYIQCLKHKLNTDIVLYNIAILHTQIQDYPKAISYYKRSIKTSINISSINNLAQLYKYLHLYKQAKQYYKMSLEHEYSSQTLINLGLICEHLNELERAEKYYKKALAEGDTMALYYLGLICMDDPNRYEEAAQYLYKYYKKSGDADVYILIEDIYSRLVKDVSFLDKYYTNINKLKHLEKQVEQLENEIEDRKLSPYPGELYIEAMNNFNKHLSDLQPN